MKVTEQLHELSKGLMFLVPELLLLAGIVLLMITSFVNIRFSALRVIVLCSFTAAVFYNLFFWQGAPVFLFQRMLRLDDFSGYFKILIDVSGILTVLISRKETTQRSFEYFLMVLMIVLGCHLLVMSINFVMVILSLELISISSYALAGFSFNRKGTEGSLKYFLFGSIATAITIYGISILYGITGTFDFSSQQFIDPLITGPTTLFVAGGILTLTGYLFKITAAPLHVWAPDVYEAAPAPVVAFFSIAPILAGFAALLRFTLAVNLFGQSSIDWQAVLAIIAILSLTVGNFAALRQRLPRRLMAYSSVAQAGFLLAGVAVISLSGVHALLFYATVFMIMNFLVFLLMQEFESGHNISTIEAYAGLGKKNILLAVPFLVGLISLAGFPMTAGFTAKLLIFSSLWASYSQSGKGILLILMVFGILNTVVAVFFYLKIPYYLFLKDSPETAAERSGKMPVIEFTLVVILAGLLLLLFFWPGLLMSWINRVNFVL